MMSKIWSEAPFEGGELLVLLALADFSDDGGECWPSVKSVAGKARLSTRRVQQVYRILVAKGWLEQIARDGKSTVYRLLTGETGFRGEISSGVKPVSQGVKPVSQRGEAHFTQNHQEPSRIRQLEPPPRARARAEAEVEPEIASIAQVLAARGCAPRGSQVDSLLMLVDEGAKPEWFERISRKASVSGKATWPYVAAICERWLRDGPDPELPHNGRSPVPPPDTSGMSEEDRIDALLRQPMGTPLRFTP